MGIIRIPQRETRTFVQDNQSDIKGSLDRSLGLDLTSNEGRVRLLRSKIVTSSANASDLETPVAFEFYNGIYYAITNNFAYKGSTTPSDSFSKDTSSNAPSGETDVRYSDTVLFNGAMYVSGANEIMKLDGATWSTPVSSGLDVSPHLMCVFEGRLYVTNNYTTVLSVNTSDVLATSGTSTIDTGLDDSWSISFLEAGNDRIWIGCLNQYTGKGIMLEWDGSDENTASRRYELEGGVVAGTILGNIPYFVDTRGRIMAYGGAGFVEVARFPKETQYRFTNTLSLDNVRFIHPNGMISVDDGRMLILINNNTEITDGYEDKCPSGVWEYDQDIGLYHKMGVSYSLVNKTVVSDYHQQRLAAVGAIKVLPPAQISVTDNGRILFGAEYFTDATTDDNFAIFIDDTLDTTEKYGLFETPWIQSSGISDIWQTIYVSNKKLLSSSDSIVVKYKTAYDTPRTATITWSDTDTFTTTTNLSVYEQGDEVEVVQGTGSGKTAHITSISEAAGTYTVNLDSQFTGATGTSIALISQWKKAGTLDTQLDDFRQFTLTASRAPQVKVKIGMQFTGENELHEITVVSKDDKRPI